VSRTPLKSRGKPTSTNHCLLVVSVTGPPVFPCMGIQASTKGVEALNPTSWLYLLVADTLLHQRGKLVHQAALAIGQAGAIQSR
jgi:hypothetical protein